MKTNQLVSIIIPAYNVEDRIEACLSSCVNQTYKELEIIVVDDGSNDNTLSICQDFSLFDKRVVVIHTNNRGVSSARNIGIEKSSGKWITFLDSDDELELHAIESLLRDVINSNSDISIGGIKEVDGEGRVLVKYAFPDILWKDKEPLVEYLKGNNPLTYSSCGKLYSKKIIGKTRFVCGRSIHEDTFFVFSIFLKKPQVIANNETVYMYVARNNSTSRQEYSDKFLDIIYFALERTKIIENNYPELIDLANNALCGSYLTYLKICISKNAKCAKEYERKSIFEVKRLKKYYIHSSIKDSIFFYVIILNLYFITKYILKTIYNN